MSKRNFVILKPVNKASFCFISEVIQWRAFGTFPESYWDNEGNDARLMGNHDNYFDASSPNDNLEFSDLSPEQARFAGLEPDPSYEMFANGRQYVSIDAYDARIAPLQTAMDQASGEGDTFAIEEALAELSQEKSEAIDFWQKYQLWRLAYEEYLDQFQNEFLLHLRKGNIKAKGRLLPHYNLSQAKRIFDERYYWTTDIEPKDIPPEFWVSKYVFWSDSILKTSDKHFVWVTVNVDDMLAIFPPSDLISSNQLHPIGNSYALTENAVPLTQPSSSNRRGRPPLPWLDFYVEVARHYRDGTMPAKKESGIQTFMDWFKAAKGIEVSRASIGQKLKPFYDALKPPANSDRK